MRRPPKALEREDRLAQMLAEANASEASSSDSDRQLRELIEDPSYELNLRPAPRATKPPVLLTAVDRKPWSDYENDPSYRTLCARLNRRDRQAEIATFAGFLPRLFRVIARANAKGPIQPDDIDLPDPPSFYRLTFERTGRARIVVRPLRRRIDELYALLEQVDVSRIKECSGCTERKLFWAAREDQRACSKSCGNRIRVREFYQRQKDTA